MKALAVEKRCAQRFESDARLDCSYLTSVGGQRVFTGKMGNYCASGIYAELKNPFRTGTILLIKARREDDSAENLPVQEGFRTISLAEVKWSQPLSREGETLYGIGMKYI